MRPRRRRGMTMLGRLAWLGGAAAIAGSSYLLVAGSRSRDDRQTAGAWAVRASRPTLAAISNEGKVTAGGHKVVARPVRSEAAAGVSHEWIVTVRDAAGSLAGGCRLLFDGWMPAHGHGLPTAPRVTRESGPGDYVVAGVRFSMPGYWQLNISIRGCGADETVTLDLRI